MASNDVFLCSCTLLMLRAVHVTPVIMYITVYIVNIFKNINV